MIKAAVGRELEPCGDTQRSRATQKKPSPGVLARKEVDVMLVPSG